VLVDVNLKAFAIALILPIRNFIAQPIEIGIAAEIKIADEHAAEMADVADFAVTEADGAEKSNSRHDGDNPLHFQSDRNRKKIGAAVREENGTGDHDAEDCA